MSSSTTVNNQSNGLIKETAIHHYIRQFVDYLDNGIDFPELSQIRQLDISLQGHYRRIRELIENLRVNIDNQQERSQTQAMLINTLIQTKIIGDKKMQLSQQMLDATERESKKLKIAQQKNVESINQLNSLSENNSNDIELENEYDSESDRHRSLWKRKLTTGSTLNVKRKCVMNSDPNEKSTNNERDRKKPTKANINSNIQNNYNGNGKRLRLNNESSTTQSDETSYCLCSQLSYGSMILCDSKTCEIKWFHFNCVNLTTKPKGKWFCPNCRENRT